MRFSRVKAERSANIAGEESAGAAFGSRTGKDFRRTGPDHDGN